MITRKILLPSIPIAGFLLIWQMGSLLGILNRSLFPPPVEIVAELIDLYRQESGGHSVLVLHLLVTLERLVYSMIAGGLAGILIGIAMGLSAGIYRFLDPVITFIMPIPGIAMAPLFIVWMGFGNPSIISVSAIAAFFPIAHNTAMGLRSIDKTLIQAAAVMGSKSMGIVFHVYIPWSAVYIFTGLKLGLARCWRTLIAVELIAAAGWGLGYMIWDAAEYLRAGVVYGGIMLLALTYIAIVHVLIEPIERRTIHKWGMIR